MATRQTIYVMWKASDGEGWGEGERRGRKDSAPEVSLSTQREPGLQGYAGKTPNNIVGSQQGLKFERLKEYRYRRIGGASRTKTVVRFLRVHIQTIRRRSREVWLVRSGYISPGRIERKERQGENWGPEKRDPTCRTGNRERDPATVFCTRLTKRGPVLTNTARRSDLEARLL